MGKSMYLIESLCLESALLGQLSLPFLKSTVSPQLASIFEGLLWEGERACLLVQLRCLAATHFFRRNIGKTEPLCSLPMCAANSLCRAVSYLETRRTLGNISASVVSSADASPAAITVPAPAETTVLTVNAGLRGLLWRSQQAISIIKKPSSTPK